LNDCREVFDNLGWQEMEIALSQTEQGQSRRGDSTDEAALMVKINCLKTLIHAFLDEVNNIERTRRASPEGLLNLREEVRRFEINLISSALRQSRGNQTLAAGLLSTKITTLNSKVKSYGIQIERVGGFKRKEAPVQYQPEERASDFL
jgi:transcriptional regulator with GAF, ATPase, and Fis domain